MPKVSVIMPVYNGAKYIGEAIESVLAQTFTDWELIVVNDGSTDCTAEIVESFNDERILMVTQPNCGEGAARNAGLRRTSGEYLAFLDSDDMFLPTALGTNALYLDVHPDVGAVYSDGWYCDANGKPQECFSDYRDANVTGRILDYIVVTPLLAAGCSVMVRKAVVRNRMLNYDPELAIGTDWDFFIRIAETELFGYNAAKTCKYRIHQRNVSFTRADVRRKCLEMVRQRVLRSPYFVRLEGATQFSVLYQLLFESYSESSQDQQQLISTGNFRTLPRESQATLLRLMAVHAIEKSWPGALARDWLRKSLELSPWDLKRHILALVFSISPSLLRSALHCRAQIRQRTSRNPVPLAFRQEA